MSPLSRVRCLQASAKKEQTEQQDLSSFEARTVGMAVRHVVLAVHGIGQRMGGRTIADDAQAVRRRVNAMLDDYMPDEIGKGYIQVLPIQWRKNLDLEVRPRRLLRYSHWSPPCPQACLRPPSPVHAHVTASLTWPHPDTAATAFCGGPLACDGRSPCSWF